MPGPRRQDHLTMFFRSKGISVLNGRKAIVKGSLQVTTPTTSPTTSSRLGALTWRNHQALHQEFYYDCENCTLCQTQTPFPISSIYSYTSCQLSSTFYMASFTYFFIFLHYWLPRFVFSWVGDALDTHCDIFAHLTLESHWPFFGHELTLL